MVRKYRSTVIRQKQIIDAARKVIVKYGSEHVTIKRIASEVGISEPAIYRHFKSKRDILSLMIDDIENALLSEIKLNSEVTPYTKETLEKVIMDHMLHVIRIKGVSFQVIAEIISLGDKRLNKKASGVIDRYTGRIKELFQEGVRAGVIRQDIDLDSASNIYFGMTLGLVNTWALNQYNFNLKEKYTSAWHILRDALTK